MDSADYVLTCEDDIFGGLVRAACHTTENIFFLWAEVKVWECDMHW